MFRPLPTAAMALAAALTLTAAPAEAQRRSDSNESSRNRDRDRDRDNRDRDGADLVVRRIRFDRDDIRVEVANVGNRRAEPSRLAVIVVTPQGRRFLTAEVPPLRPGQDRTVRVETNFRVNVRGTEIIAIADFFNDVRERNERNNTLTRFVD